MAAALSLLSAANASAATNLSQKPGSAGCLSEQGVPAGCGDGRGLVGPTAIAFSPDGANAYVTAATGDSLAILARDPGDGTLTQAVSPAACFDSHEFPNPECPDVVGLRGARDVEVSPDGANVYVVSSEDDTVLVFDRDPGTGALTLSGEEDGCVNQDGSGTCADGRALEGAAGILVSPDGENVYTAAENTGGGIAVFDRDPETGDLTQKAGTAGCFHNSGADGCADDPNPTLGARNLTLSAGGDVLYAVSPGSETVTIYTRDGESGELTPRPAPGGCISDSGAGGCPAVRGLGEPTSLTIGPGGDTAYVASDRNNAIVVFDRNPEDGGLAQKGGTAGCITYTGWSDPMQPGTAGECADGVAMDGINSIAVLPDGSALFATAAESDGLVVFERRPDGTLTQRPKPDGCITETGFELTILPETAGFCGDGRSLLHASSVVASPEGRFVYTTASQGGVGTFDVVEPPPVPEAVPPPAPPAVVPKDNSGCRRARRALRKTERRLVATQRRIRRRARLANRARKKPAVRRRLRKAQRKDRNKLRRIQKVRRKVARRARRACS